MQTENTRTESDTFTMQALERAELEQVEGGSLQDVGCLNASQFYIRLTNATVSE
jgi:hypothetical protein